MPMSLLHYHLANLFRRKIVKFGFVGGVAAATHYLSALALLEGAEFSVQASYVTGYWLGFIVSYVGHSVVTFSKAPTLKSLVGYLVLALVNYLLSASILWSLEDLMALPPALAMFVVVLTIPVISFVVSRYIIFR